MYYKLYIIYIRLYEENDLHANAFGAGCHSAKKPSILAGLGQRTGFGRIGGDGRRGGRIPGGDG
jgi:hypothetical protein